MTGPRIQLIHAVTAAQAPIHDAFRRLWPEARIADVADYALAPDLAAAGRLTDDFTGRMATLIAYGVACGADAVLFTCSAFGAAIERARRDARIPVLKPDEAMIEKALALGCRIGGLATFQPTIASLEAELTAAAGKRGVAATLDIRYVPGALDALNAGDGAGHNALLADAAAGMTGGDVILLAQFSMVGARDAVAAKAGGRHVLTAPDEAVGKLRSLLD
ncbi:MAG: arylsulfatase [Rhodospirillales bacterium]|nr:arylsulfatase [Rhodospirillales bacterium]